MGARVATASVRPGFYPAGGGAWSVTVEPLDAPRALDATQRTVAGPVSVEAMRANLSGGICERELAAAAAALDVPGERLRHTSHDGPGPGNAVLVRVPLATHTEVFGEIGRHGVKAESVARRAAGLAQSFLDRDAAVSELLADQLLLPLSLLAGGAFTTTALSGHFLTNVDTIRLFLDVDVTTRRAGSGHLVEVARSVG